MDIILQSFNPWQLAMMGLVVLTVAGLGAYRMLLERASGLSDAQKLGQFKVASSTCHSLGLLGICAAAVSARSPLQPVDLVRPALLIWLAVAANGLSPILLLRAQETWRHQTYQRQDRQRLLLSSMLATPASIVTVFLYLHADSWIPIHLSEYFPYAIAAAAFGWIAYARSTGRLQQTYEPLVEGPMSEFLDHWSQHAQVSISKKMLIVTGSGRVVDVRWLNDGVVGVTDATLEQLRPPEQRGMAALAIALRVCRGAQGPVGTRIPWSTMGLGVVVVLVIVSIGVVAHLDGTVVSVLGMIAMMTLLSRAQQRQTRELLRRVDSLVVEWLADPEAYYKLIARTGLCNLNPRLLPGVGISTQLDQRLREVEQAMSLPAERAHALLQEVEKDLYGTVSISG